MAAIANELVIFLVILGAGFVVLMGFAIIPRFQRRDRSAGQDAYLEATGQNQESYMREVRMRNQHQIAAAFGFGRRYE